MKKLIVLAVAAVFVSLAPSLAAQTAAGLTGKWEGTMTIQRPDGTAGNPSNIVFDLTQKGKLLTGTAGPADQQLPIAKGAVNAGKASFEVQLPNGGPLFKFTLASVKGHLQGEMATDAGGVARHAKVDMAKAAAPKKK